MSYPETIAIVGAGHAAGQAVATLKHLAYPGRILLFGEENRLPYQRPPLSKKYLAGEFPAERLHFKPADFYDDPRIDVHLGCRVERIDRDRKKLHTAEGGEFSYDGLILAPGARTRQLRLPGHELGGIHYLRTIDDVDTIRDSIARGDRMAVVGGGYIGLEVAAVARLMGQQVTVIEAAGRVMSRVVSPLVSAFYEKLHLAHGIDLRLDSVVTGFSGKDRVEAVLLSDGQRIDADTVVIGIGIEPATELACNAGLDVDDGIAVDDLCRSSDPTIYAVGDCTSHPNPIIGGRIRLESVHNALEQAKTAAANLLGQESRYHQVPWFWSDQYDVKLQIAGLSQGYDREVLRGDPDSGAFSCVYLKRDVVIAVDAINQPRDFVQAKSLIAKHAVVDPQKLANADEQLKNMAG